MVLWRVFLEDYSLILPLPTLRGRDHLEGRDSEMFVLSVLQGRDHSSDFKLSPGLPEDIILQLMHSIRHLLPLACGPNISIPNNAASLCYSAGYPRPKAPQATMDVPQRQ